MRSIKTILKARGKTHGDFTDNAAISQRFKEIIREHDVNLSDVQKEGLDMIAHKLGRILAGNPNEPDHYDDIAGYATLMSERIKK